MSSFIHYAHATVIILGCMKMSIKIALLKGVYKMKYSKTELNTICNALRANGCTVFNSMNQLNDKLNPLGYKLTANYCKVMRCPNWENKHSYDVAFSYYTTDIICISSGKSYSNIESNKDKLAELQAMRYQGLYFIHNKSIYVI